MTFEHSNGDLIGFAPVECCFASGTYASAWLVEIWAAISRGVRRWGGEVGSFAMGTAADAVADLRLG